MFVCSGAREHWCVGCFRGTDFFQPQESMMISREKNFQKGIQIKIFYSRKKTAETLIKKKKRLIVNPISFSRYHGISPNTAFSLLNARAEMVSLPLSTNTCLSECLCQLSCTAFYLYTQYMFSYLCLSFARVGRHWSGVYHSMATGHRTRSRRSAKEKTCGQE